MESVDEIRERVRRKAWQLLEDKINHDQNRKYTVAELTGVVSICDNGFDEDQLNRILAHVDKMRRERAA